MLNSPTWYYSGPWLQSNTLHLSTTLQQAHHWKFLPSALLFLSVSHFIIITFFTLLKYLVILNINHK